MPTSQNAWPANDWSRTQSYKVAGSTRALRLVKGPAGELLAALAAWLHANVEKIDAEKTADDWGYAERPIRGSTTTLSNHASGTAFDFNATQHPLGVAGTWSTAERTKINAKLNQLGGTVRWGDNYSGRKDGMHFEINVPPTTAGLTKIGAALKVLQGAKPGDSVKPPATNPYPTITASSIRYAATPGSYFHSGQAEALKDAREVVAWAGPRRQKILTEHDIRVWDTHIRNENWQLAGTQYRGLIRKIQAHYGLVADGEFGPKTAAKMAVFGYTFN